MKVIHISKRHVRRLVVAILVLSFVLSFYLHSRNADDDITSEPRSVKHKHKQKHKNKQNKQDESADTYDYAILENPTDVKEPQSYLINEEDDPADEDPEDDPETEEPEEVTEKPEVHDVGSHMRSDVSDDIPIKKWRLEEIDAANYADWPKLTTGTGNYEARPPIPDVGSAGHDRDNTGEGGLSPIKLTSVEQNKVSHSLQLWGFNLVASDKVNMDRVPADLRMSECKHWDYPDKMAAVSVILVFHNEGFSTLLRTVHSIINYSPPEMLQEVVMLDDGSTREYITNGTIDRYVERWNGLVKVFHNDKREGLIRARTIGGKHSTGSIQVYLDAHCEVEPNWLPPLVAPIMADYRVCTVPMVDSIDGNTYIFEPQQGGDEDNLARGAWDWNFDWKRIPLNAREKARRKTRSEPYRSPAMAGGLFAISTRWFEELGYYDDHLEIWGGENFELSYKLWQCGGQLLFVPCSRVGHIYRMPGWGGNGTPDDLKGKNFIAVNYNRVIETWWDDNYKKYYYAQRPENKNVDPGDLTEVLEVKEKLQCKDFSWYMKEIAYDIPKYWPMVLPGNVATGSLKNIGTGMCPMHYPVEQGGAIHMSKEKCENQWTLSWHEDIQVGDGSRKGAKCWDDSMGPEKHIAFWECHKGYGNQLYKYRPESQQIYHPSSRKCAMAKKDEEKEGFGFIVFATCDPANEDQKWAFDTINEIPLQRANANKEIPGNDPPELDYIS